jgi:hypothetical protein
VLLETGSGGSHCGSGRGGGVGRANAECKLGGGEVVFALRRAGGVVGIVNGVASASVSCGMSL